MARVLSGDEVTAVAMEVMGRPWAWGTADCCASACEVFWRLYGFDPMADLRGRYQSAVGALRLVKLAGGLVPLAERLARVAHLAAGQGAPGELAVSLPGVADGLGGRALLIGLGAGLYAGKSRAGMVMLTGADRSWACAD